MPSPLHPKSIQTTSLFGTTLLISFLVVGLPHIMPCPVDRRQFAEGQMDGIDAHGRRRRRRRTSPDGDAPRDDEVEVEEKLKARTRECPVPKPRGLVGQVMGFKQEQRMEKPSVRVQGSEGND